MDYLKSIDKESQNPAIHPTKGSKCHPPPPPRPPCMRLSFSRIRLPALLRGLPQPHLVVLLNLPTPSSAHPTSSFTHIPPLRPSLTRRVLTTISHPRSPFSRPCADLEGTPLLTIVLHCSRPSLPTLPSSLIIVGSALASSTSTAFVCSLHACPAVPPSTPTLSSAHSHIVVQPAGFNRAMPWSSFIGAVLGWWC
ncbi:hypothetical protein CPC08DRAFT_771159 [Agrocybe pediades]|nr:hypothetical protein CPC08DRAFT_771159 [Agrocybe pediades]